MPNERRNRLEMLGLTTNEVAGRLSITLQHLHAWVDGSLSPEEGDTLEVGISLLEMRLRQQREVTERILQYA